MQQTRFFTIVVQRKNETVLQVQVKGADMRVKSCEHDVRALLGKFGTLVQMNGFQYTVSSSKHDIMN